MKIFIIFLLMLTKIKIITKIILMLNMAVMARMKEKMKLVIVMTLRRIYNDDNDDTYI